MDRITYIDTAKFLAIYFVIVSHCSMGSHISNFLFSFHVPLFFILYGYVHNSNYNMKIRSWIRQGGVKLIYRILIPYFLLAFILGSSISVKSLCLVSLGSIQSITGITSTHLWFLPCYFCAVFIYNITELLMKSHQKLFFTVILIFALLSYLLDCNADIVLYVRDYIVHLTGYGIIDDKHYCIGLPMGFNVALSGCLFIYIGKLFSTIINKWEMLKIPLVRFTVLIISVIIGIFFYILNDGDSKLIAMSLAKYGNYCYFVTTAIFFSFATILLSMFLNNPVFSRYGKYTLAIYGFHLSLTFVPNIFCQIINLDVENNADLKGLLFGTIVLIVSCMIIPFIRKVDSNLIGERN